MFKKNISDQSAGGLEELRAFCVLNKVDKTTTTWAFVLSSQELCFYKIIEIHFHLI